MNSYTRLPRKIEYCIIGAGIHGLSTAYHLALELRSQGISPEGRIIVIDKTGVGAGATGIACGVIRNNYFQPAMSAVMVESVKVWEQHAAELEYHAVGYLAIAGPDQADDLCKIAARHATSNYPHTLIEGKKSCDTYLRGLFPDWKESDASAVLHESNGGFAYARHAIDGLGKLVAEQGIPIISGVEVTGFDFNGSDETITSVHTSRGSIEVDSVVVAVGPWIQNCWSMLQLPSKIDVRDRKGELYPNRDMWTYWQLQEGEVTLDNDVFTLANGADPPVVHIDSEEPLVDESGKNVTEGPWGIYFKRDHGNVQGGAVPYSLGTEAEVDPYGPASPYYTVDPAFIRYWTAGLARSMKRFEGCSEKYRNAPSGGIGCFSVDNFPVFDFMRPNVFVIADSNHGFKMIGVGKEVAATLVGQKSRVLSPFRFSRFLEGELHPVSSSPFPWA
jgi:glycine/D-amino acid oxidase-like deaminating enzyme